MTNLDSAKETVPSGNGGGGLQAINTEVTQPASAAEADTRDDASRIDPNNRANKVEEFFPGKHDSGGRHIDMVYFKRDDYAIYRSGAQVLVIYSDVKATADKQIAAVSALLPLRDHLANLIRDLPEGARKAITSRKWRTLCGSASKARLTPRRPSLKKRCATDWKCRRGSAGSSTSNARVWQRCLSRRCSHRSRSSCRPAMSVS